MTKIIRNVSELPKWFQLSKYEPAASLDGTGWLEQLTVRRDLPGLIGIGRKRALSQYFIDGAFAVVQENPIVDIVTEGPMRALFYGGPLPELRNSAPYYSHGAHFATVYDLYKIEANVYQSVQKKARAWSAHYLGDMDWLSPDALKFNLDEIQHWIHAPVDQFSAHKSPLIKINPDLPDAVLLKEFKRLLRSMRDPNGPNYRPVKEHEKPNFLGWVTFGVLPYLDLKLWALTVDASIPNRVMADAIFPPGEGGEEVVRKTTSKLAIDLVSEGHMTQLASFAAYQISEQDNEP